MPIYSIAVIQFDDISPGFTTTDTVGNSVEGQTFTVSAGASPIGIQVDDDDLEFDDGFIDPPGNTTSANNQLVAEPVTINGVAYGPASAGGTPQDQVELEFAFTTTDGDTFYVVRIDGVNVGLSGPTLPQAGQVFTVDTASDGIDTLYEDVPCFAEGTMILTPDGYVAVENLAKGDFVVTFDNGPMPLDRVMSTRLSVETLIANPDLRPIHFRTGAFGNTRAMRLSPQHRILISGWRAELYFGEPQVLVPAKALVNGTNVDVEPPDRPVIYFHLLLADHQLLFSDGAVTESMYPDHQLARSYSPTGSELVRILERHSTGERGLDLVRPSVRVKDALILGNASMPFADNHLAAR